MDAAITAAAGANCVGSFMAGKANTEEIHMQYDLMLIPPAYAHLVLNCSIVPQDLWNELGTTVIADGQQLACAPLLDWM
jgi:hypothetical protein